MIVRVGHAEVVVRGPDPAAAVPVVQEGLVAGLEEVGRRWPDEWLFVRRVEIALRARTGREAIDAGGVAKAIAAVLGRRFEAVRARVARPGVEGVIAEDVAWFPSEGAARGALVGALLAGTPPVWPCTAMTWARTLGEVERWSVIELGDALAHAIGHAAAPVAIPEPAARAWVGRWLGGRVTFDVEALPAEVRARIAATAQPGEGDEAARLRALAHLFAAWPPARDATVDVRAIDRLAGRGDRAAAAPPIPSRAGGLVAWAVLAHEHGLDRALWGELPDERLVRAARWAVGRALEAGDVGDGDPMLRLWAGERVDGPPLARWVFDELDPRRLHAGALRFALAQGWLGEPLVLAPLAGGAALMAGDLCVDYLPGGVDDALPPMVRDLVARTGRPPAGVTVEAQHAPAAIDGFAEVDVMALPDGWRAAVRAAASVARRLAATRWRVALRDLRAWPARVRPGAPAAIELPRPRASRVPVELDGIELALAGVPVRVTLAI